jgi:hypothetical protein
MLKGGQRASASLEIEDFAYAMESIMARLSSAGVLSSESTVALGTRITELAGMQNSSSQQMEHIQGRLESIILEWIVERRISTVIKNPAKSDYSFRITISGGESISRDPRFNISFQLWKSTPDTHELVFAASEIVQVRK